MAITDIQISDELQTSAPSIKYRGNEGPKAPMETAMADPMLIEEYQRYVYEMQEQGREPVSFEQFVQEIMAGMAEGGRVPAAFGGIMDSSTGRRAYKIGSKIKKRIRKIIPNEVARAAEVAAPFVAPFNPIAGGLMAGVGGFDRTGSIGKSLKSGLINYGMGQAARYVGGGAENLQTGFNPMNTANLPGATGQGIRGYFSSPIQDTGGLGQWLTKDAGSTAAGATSSGKDVIVTGNEADEILNLGKIDTKTGTSLTDKILKGVGMNTAAMAGIIGASALAGLYTKANPGDDSIKQMRGSGIDIEGIRTEVIEAMKDPSGEKLAAIRSKYPFLGARETINVDLLAKGGRIGKAEGGIMDLGGMEKDYRNTGGFVDIGAKEKADDVPARLSVNEFVMTADAVRGAGGGDIDKGAEIMENVMKNLEEGGRISEESQGLTNRRQGASDMFEVSERLSAVV